MNLSRRCSQGQGRDTPWDQHMHGIPAYFEEIISHNRQYCEDPGRRESRSRSAGKGWIPHLFSGTWKMAVCPEFCVGGWSWPSRVQGMVNKGKMPGHCVLGAVVSFSCPMGEGSNDHPSMPCYPGINAHNTQGYTTIFLISRNRTELTRMGGRPSSASTIFLLSNARARLSRSWKAPFDSMKDLPHLRGPFVQGQLSGEDHPFPAFLADAGDDEFFMGSAEDEFLADFRFVHGPGRGPGALGKGQGGVQAARAGHRFDGLGDVDGQLAGHQLR